LRFGLTLPNMHYGALPSRDHIWRVAEAAESSGYDSVWASDHVLVGSAYPRYGTLFEALTTLAWLAGRTARVRLGTSILVLPMRSALVVAKQAATLDAVSEGRLVLGVGVGWMEAEYKFLGADFHQRGRRLDESIAVLRNLWTQHRPAFTGEWYRYEDSLFEPKPAQANGPPIWIGGNSDAALRRAGRLGDAWHADDVMPEDFARAQEKLRTYAAGRQVSATIRFTVDLYAATGSGKAGAKVAGYYQGEDADPGMKGSFESMRAFLRRYHDLGVTDFICQFEHDSADRHVEFIRTFAREVVSRL
jgi:probable F420-dependent oxidoreductase